MSKGISTRTRTEHDDEHDGYVLVDTRNVILGLPEEVEAGGARRPLRAEISQKSESERWTAHRDWPAFTGPRRQAVARRRVLVDLLLAAVGPPCASRLERDARHTTRVMTTR